FCAGLINRGVIDRAYSASAGVQTARPSKMFNADALLKDLKILSADDMQGRRVETPGSEKARQYIVERFRQSRIQPLGNSYLYPFVYTPQRGRTAAAPVHGVNVVGWIAGARNPRRYVVVSAHYDHLGVRNGVVFNGADDNASGTAGLFSVAEYFSSHP